MTEPSSGRPSAVQPHVKLERRVSPFFATFFYGFIFAAAWVWLERGTRTSMHALLFTPNLLRDAMLGVGVGCFFVALTPIFVRLIPAVADLEREFGWIVGEQRGYEIVFLALLSGTAEEALFRGAMYQVAGPAMSTIIFGAVHWPINWSFRAWPILAVALGAVMALERHLTGGVLAPILTHVTINLVNLFRVTKKFRVWKE